MSGGRQLLSLRSVALVTVVAAIAIAVSVGRQIGWNDLTRVTPIAFAVALTAALAVVSISAFFLLRAAFERPHTTSATSHKPRWQAALGLAMLFLVVFCAKLLLMRSNPVTVPYWDQWDGEGAAIFVPFNDGTLSWQSMFALHNEHRIFFSRLLALGLLTANGQWDPRLEQVVNAALHSLTAVLVAALLWTASERRYLEPLLVVCAITFALPFGWENTLAGFQSAFYFLLLFSVLALGLTTTSRPGTARWWLGWLCAACSLVTAAGGLLTPLAIAGVTLLTIAKDRQEWPHALVNVGAAAVVLALGVALMSPALEYHAALKAQSATAFRLAIAHNLAWPWIDQALSSLVMWLPLAALLATAFRQAPITRLEQVAVGLGLWVVLNAAAIAYGRGAGGGLPAIRYMDFLSLGFLANLAALVSLVARPRPLTFTRRLALGALVGWLLFAMVGLDRLVSRAMTDLSISRQYAANQASNVRRFLMTGDLDTLLSQAALVELPYPDPKRLATLLQDPYIRRILPATVRKPLQVRPRIATEQGFVLNGPFIDSLPRDPLQSAWLSLSAQGRKARGRFESESLRCELRRRLRFQVSGYLGWEHQYLAIRELSTGRETAITPWHLAREDWRDVIVPCPEGEFEIVAVDDTDGSWFGFREPVEIGWASAAAEWLIQSSRAPFIVFVTMAVLALAVRRT
ncbi:MAG TPA: hypothetical protein VM818_18610 [Vicinamibacterales bacterium]|nr:hypothetical protein [Vicinamibacterales bacterium]